MLASGRVDYFMSPRSLTSIHVASDDDLYDGATFDASSTFEIFSGATCKTMCTTLQCAFYWEGLKGLHGGCFRASLAGRTGLKGSYNSNI